MASRLLTRSAISPSPRTAVCFSLPLAVAMFTLKFRRTVKHRDFGLRVCTWPCRGTCIIVRLFYIVRPYYDARHGALSQAASLEDSQRDSLHIYGHSLSRGTRRPVHRAARDRTANEQDRHFCSFWVEGTATVGYCRSRKASLLGAGGTAFAHAPKGYTAFACNAGELDWVR